MKHQDLFSLTDKSKKKIKVSSAANLLQVLLVTLTESGEERQRKLTIISLTLNSFTIKKQTTKFSSANFQKM